MIYVRACEHLNHRLHERVKENIAHAKFHVVKELFAVVSLSVKHNGYCQATDQMMVKLYV